MPSRRKRRSRPQRPIHIELIWPDPPPDPRCKLCRRPINQPATGRHRRYCSDACRQKRHRLRRRNLRPVTFYISRDYRRAERQLAKIERKHGRLDETPQFGPNSIRDYILHYLANDMPLNRCRACGKPVENRSGSGLGRIYCSHGCKSRDTRRRHRIGHAPFISHFGRMVYWEEYDIPLNDAKLRICAQCHIPFTRHATGRQPIYCSHKCRQKAYRQRKHGRIIGYRLCDACKNVYPARARWQRFCSPSCKHAWQWKTHAPPPKTIRRETCVICYGALPPQPQPRGSFRQYCSPQCKGKAKRLPRKQREMERFVTHTLGGFVTPRGTEIPESAEIPLSAPIFTPDFEPYLAPLHEEELIASK